VCSFLSLQDLIRNKQTYRDQDRAVIEHLRPTTPPASLFPMIFIECAVPALPPALSVCNLSAIHTFEVVVRFLSGPASAALSQLLPLSPHQFKYYGEGRILLISRNWTYKVALLLARRHTMMTKSKSRSGSRTLIFKDREGGPAPREKIGTRWLSQALYESSKHRCHKAKRAAFSASARCALQGQAA
jgi:hypothetical protein